MRAVNSSWILRSTNSRVPALQISPELANAAMPAPGTAASRSASANTTSGDLPPSSSDTRFRFPAEAAMIFCPGVPVYPACRQDRRTRIDRRRHPDPAGEGC